MNHTKLSVSLIPSLFLLFCAPVMAQTEMTKTTAFAKQYPDVFTVKKDELVIHLQNKKDVSFKTVKDQGEINSQVTVVDYIDPANVAVLEKQGYEWMSYSMISLVDGKETKIVGPMTWAPDWKHFIAIGESEQGDSSVPAFQLGKCVKNVCTVNPADYGKVTAVSWKNKDHPVLTFQIESKNTCSIQKEKLLCSRAPTP